MATVFRATVMLVVLVGLPAAWVYYGPLPPAAMGVIERTVASAKQSLGWNSPRSSSSWSSEPAKTAPLYDTSIAQATSALQQVPREPTTPTRQAIRRDSQFSLASAAVPVQQTNPLQQTNVVQQAVPSVEVDGELAAQLEPHLALLRSLNAAEYTLENWGGSGELYRFRCSVTLGDSDDHTRQFEAVHADPLRAVHTVVGEVTSWQNARHAGTTTRWQ